VLNERAQSPAPTARAACCITAARAQAGHPVAGDAAARRRRPAAAPPTRSARRSRSSPATPASTPSGACPTACRGSVRASTRSSPAGSRRAPRTRRRPRCRRRSIAQIAAWEAFLNQDSPKVRLASRYIYEHLFLAHLHFADGDAGTRRSSSSWCARRRRRASRSAIIATRRPYDDPGVERPYYRLVPVREAIVAKLHLPYRSTPRGWSGGGAVPRRDYAVTELPSYAPEVASNPFVAFRAIPVPSRYRFMIDEAEFTMMGFIKGAVCRGRSPST
jgi:hypothetical protein